MKFVKQASLFAVSLAAFFGCSSEKNTDALVATVGNEKIYASDIDFIQRASQSYAKPGMEIAALENIIEARLIFQEAKKIVGENNAKIEQTLEDLSDRLLARAYDDFYIGQNLGHTDAELGKHFAANRNKFAADSCFSLGACRSKVAESLYLEENADSLFRYVSRKVEEMGSGAVEIAYVELADSSDVPKAENALSGGAPDSLFAVKKISLESNALRGVWSNAEIRELLFGKNALAAGNVRSATADNGKIVFKVLLRREGEKFPEEGRDSILKSRFLMEFRDNFANNGDGILRAKYRFRAERPVYPEVRAYYGSHTEEFGGAPFDSVSAQIERKLSAGGDIPLDSNAVLATLDGKPFIFEKDVQKLLEEMPANIRMRYPRMRRVFMLAGWKLRAMAAREAHLDTDGLLQKIRQNMEMNFYRKAFADSLARNGFFTPDDTLRKLFARYGERLFPNAGFEKVRGELGIFARTPDREFLFEYYRNPGRFAETSDVDSIKVRVFESAMGTFSRDWFERYRRDLFQKYPVTVYDSAFLPRTDLFSVRDLEVRADSFYAARELSGAHLTWDRIRALSAFDDTLFRRAVYELAKIDGEREKYEAASGEFAAYYAMWPESPDAEKALFNRAFILHENLKRDSLALPLFEEFQSKFPQSDLRESVDWLVRDIRSGGKLAAELLEKISRQEENSN